MYLVQIDVVGLQAAQGSLKLTREPASRIASLVWVITHRQVRLGGKDDVVAPPFKRLPDDFLRFASAIRIGRIDQVDSCIQSSVDDPDRVVVVGVAQCAKHHRAQTIGADFDARFSECAVLHVLSPAYARWLPAPPCSANLLQSEQCSNYIRNDVPFVKWRCGGR